MKLIYGGAILLCFFVSTYGLNLRGVCRKNQTLYNVKGGFFECFDKSKKISSSKLNDDYCDCQDGSDEPGTSACNNGEFCCKNAGYLSKVISSTLVNDFICDCCDGSDEASGLCQNVCLNLYENEKQAAMTEINKIANAKHKCLNFLSNRDISKKKFLSHKNEWKKELNNKHIERDELNASYSKLESSFEKTKKDYYSKNMNNPDNMLLFYSNIVDDVFSLMDTNKDNILDVNESLPLRLSVFYPKGDIRSVVFDKKYLIDALVNDENFGHMFLNQFQENGAIVMAQLVLERMEVEFPDCYKDQPHLEDRDFTKDILKLKKEVFLSYSNENGDDANHKEDETAEAYDNDLIAESKDEESKVEEANDEESNDEEANDEETDSTKKEEQKEKKTLFPGWNAPFKSESENIKKKPSKSDEMEKNLPTRFQDYLKIVKLMFTLGKITKQKKPLPELPKEVKAIEDDLKTLRDKIITNDHEISHLKKDIHYIELYETIDFGPDNVFSILFNECFNFSENHYTTYEFCPFKYIIQHFSHKSYLLGEWKEWKEPLIDYKNMHFDNGDKCGSESRVANVELICGSENKVIGVGENERCIYTVRFENVASCHLHPTPVFNEEIYRDEL